MKERVKRCFSCGESNAFHAVASRDLLRELRGSVRDF
jgi:hypothetical protein